MAKTKKARLQTHLRVCDRAIACGVQLSPSTWWDVSESRPDFSLHVQNFEADFRKCLGFLSGFYSKTYGRLFRIAVIPDTKKE